MSVIYEHIHPNGFTRVYCDPPGNHRYGLLHVFDLTQSERWLVVIITAPQGASAEFRELGVKRTVNYAEARRYHGVAILNLHSRVTPRAYDTAERRTDPQEVENYSTVHAVLARMLGPTRRCKQMDVLCAWGQEANGRQERMVEILKAYEHPTFIVGMTKIGQPVALYDVTKDTEMKPWPLPSR